MATVVLTRPQTAGVPGTITTGVEIPPSSTVVTDSCACQNNLSVKWIYTLMDSVNEEVFTAEVVANHDYGTNARWNRYGMVGDSMPHRVEVIVSGGDLQLSIQNLSPTNTYTANIVRIEVLA